MPLAVDETVVLTDETDETVVLTEEADVGTVVGALLVPGLEKY